MNGDIITVKGKYCIEYSQSNGRISCNSDINIFKGKSESFTAFAPIVKQIRKCKFINEDNFAKKLFIYQKIAEQQSLNLLSLMDYVQTSSHHYMIFEEYDRDTLTNIINKQMLGTEIAVINAFRQVCNGLANLHKNNEFNVNLSTSNILVSTGAFDWYPLKLYLAIGNYGCDIINFDSSKTLCMGSMEHETSSDISGNVYSAGCLLYKMLTGLNLLDSVNNKENEEKKKHENLLIQSKVGKLSKFTLSLLERCLQHSPAQRISADDLFKLMKITSFNEKEYEPIILGEESPIQSINLLHGSQVISEESNPEKAVAIPLDQESIEESNVSKIDPNTSKKMRLLEESKYSTNIDSTVAGMENSIQSVYTFTILPPKSTKEIYQISGTVSIPMSQVIEEVDKKNSKNEYEKCLIVVGFKRLRYTGINMEVAGFEIVKAEEEKTALCHIITKTQRETRHEIRATR